MHPRQFFATGLCGHDYRIAYTFGWFPLQQYLVQFPGGKLQALGIAWDGRTLEEGGQGWFHLYPDEADMGAAPTPVSPNGATGAASIPPAASTAGLPAASSGASIRHASATNCTQARMDGSIATPVTAGNGTPTTAGTMPVTVADGQVASSRRARSATSG